MKFQTSSNIIPLFEGVVRAIQPYAISNQVKLRFSTQMNQLILEYHPEEIICDITQLLCNVIAFTPQTFNVELIINKADRTIDSYLLLEVHNDGVNLARIGEITSRLKNHVKVIPIDQNETLFQLFIPFSKDVPQGKNFNQLKINHYGIPPYYAQVRKKLRSHFSNMENLERAAALQSQTKGIFLQKLNALISSNLGNEGFNTDCLCKGMALSRTQLYRKLKSLTYLPPAQYIQFVRLQKAKEFLQNTNMNVGEVVLKVGFASHSHFTRAFHDQFGINPSFLKKET